MGSVGANGQQRLSLSMRDVDQASGKDLLPTHLLPGTIIFNLYNLLHTGI